MRGLMVGMMVLWLAVPAAPQEAPRQIRLRVVPADAKVSDTFGYIGIADGPLNLRPAASYLNGSVEFHLEAPGYKPFVLEVNNQKLANQAVFPEAGTPPIYLPPAAPLAYFTYYRGSIAFVALILTAAGVAYLRLRPKIKHVQEVTELINRSARDSVISAGRNQRVALGERLGAYLIAGELGKGAMGTVFRGVPSDNPKAEAVAIKVLHVDSSQVLEFYPRFQREAELYRMLRHPNIVTMVDYGEVDGLVFLVLELIDGGTLGQRLTSAGCTPQEARLFLKPLFAAVQFAHDQGVVHRDLKPDNMMLTAKGVLKVTDFGLGRSLTSKTLTASGDALGTPAYMAPEQIMGVHFEPATDQYALGIIAFEMLVGRLPFEANDPMQAIYQHVSVVPPDASSMRAGLPPQIDATLQRMLAKQPGQRFPLVDDAWNALSRGIDIWADG